MISFEEYNTFPSEVKDKMINTVFNENPEDVLDMIRDNIVSNGVDSPYIKPLLNNIEAYASSSSGMYYEVKSLVFVKNKK